MRKRTSIIWQISTEEMTAIVKRNNSLANIIRDLNLTVAGSHYKTLKKRLDEDEINYSHIPVGLNSNKNRTFRKALPLNEVMIENSTYSRGSLKRRLLKEGILVSKCVICGQLPEHNGQKLVMVLDHINGINNDHRLENLRLLCPNCNSQQETFCGRHSKSKKHSCISCYVEIPRKRKYCDNCYKEHNSMSQRRVERPSKEQLLKEIKETNYCAVGRKYGVSDNAVRKWVR